ncbi:hypothetical protein U9M48_029423 [Paspalum notatum var. saurae]|uniref:Uncharacterized protein n=1 Tax=Paspalum notatum var. saurae TaxID=547442 RepID=A0AAQ3X1J0_PASNO
MPSIADPTMAATDDGREKDGDDAPLETLSLDLPPDGEKGELWNILFECIGAPRDRDFVELGLDRAYISFFNLLRLQEQLGYSLRDYMYHKKRCGKDVASLEVIDTQRKAREMVESNETERRIRITMTKDPLTELQVSISPIKHTRETTMNEEPHVEEDINEYKIWLAEMVYVYPEMGKEYKDDYRQATIKTYKQWLTTQNKLPDDHTNDDPTIPEDETQDSTPSLTKWPSHARRHKEKVNGPKKRGRGTLKGYTGAYKRIKIGSQKLQIQFSSRLGGPIGINHRTFVDEVTMFTRMRTPLIGVKSWKDVMDNVKESIASDVLNKWDLQNIDNAEQKILDIARERYKGWRGTLSATYKAYKTDADRMKNKPEDVDTIEWYYLLKYFATEEFKQISRKNTGCCKEKKSKHCTGSTSFSQRSFQQRDQETGEKPDDIELWLSTHTRNGRWTNSASQDVYSVCIINAISRLSERETEQEGNNPTRKERNDIFQKTYKEIIGCKTTRIYGHRALAKYPTRAQLMVAQIEHSRVTAADQQKRIELEADVQKLKEQVARDVAEREKFAQEVEEREQLKWEELREQLRKDFRAQLRKEMQSMFAAKQQSNPPSNTENDGTPVLPVGNQRGQGIVRKIQIEWSTGWSSITFCYCFVEKYRLDVDDPRQSQAKELHNRGQDIAIFPSL